MPRKHKIQPILFFLVCFALADKTKGNTAQASDSLEYSTLQGTDTLGSSPLSFNISSLNLKDSTLSVAEQIKQKEITFVQDSTGSAVTSQTSSSETVRAIEFLSSGAGITYGVGINYSLTEDKSTNTQSGNFQRTALLETFKRAEGRGKVSLELSKDFRLGAMVRYRHLDADVLGSFFMPLNERTRYSGGLIGAGASAQFNTSSAGIAIQYMSPIQGKVQILGENKVTSEPGTLSGCGHLSIFISVSLGSCYVLSNHAKDELRRSTTGPNPDNNTQLSPKGVQNERNLLRYSTILGGAAISMGSNFKIRLTGFLEEHHVVNNPDDVPKSDDDSDNVIKGYRGRLGLALVKGAVNAELGGDYAKRTHSFPPANNGSISTLNSTETNFFATIGVSF